MGRWEFTSETVEKGKRLSERTKKARLVESFRIPDHELLELAERCKWYRNGDLRELTNGVKHTRGYSYIFNTDSEPIERDVDVKVVGEVVTLHTHNYLFRPSAAEVIEQAKHLIPESGEFFIDTSYYADNATMKMCETVDGETYHIGVSRVYVRA